MKIRHKKMARAAYRQRWSGTKQGADVCRWHRQFRSIKP